MFSISNIHVLNQNDWWFFSLFLVEITGIDSSPTYELLAIANHDGSIDSGHYTALCRDQASSTWYLYNDDR